MEPITELLGIIARNGLLGLVTAILAFALIYIGKAYRQALIDRVEDVKKSLEGRIEARLEMTRALERNTAAFEALTQTERDRTSQTKDRVEALQRLIQEVREIIDENTHVINTYAEDQRRFRDEIRQQIITFTKDLQDLKRRR